MEDWWKPIIRSQDTSHNSQYLFIFAVVLRYFFTLFVINSLTVLFRGLDAFLSVGGAAILLWYFGTFLIVYGFTILLWNLKIKSKII